MTKPTSARWKPETVVPPGEDPADWAIRTGRVKAGGAVERVVRAMASASRAAAVQLVERLESVDPQVLADVRRGESATDDEVYSALFSSEGDDVPAPPAGGGYVHGRYATPAVAAGAPPAPSTTSGAYARRPVLDDYAEQRHPVYVAAARSGVPAPTLFASGDLPTRTASGIPPSELLRVPWRARHTIAAAGPEEAHRLVERYSRPDSDLDLQYDREVADHPANAEYAAAVQHWLSKAGTGQAG